MTWVLGTNTPFGYAVGLSDIRVTVADQQFDCLQKVYPISRFVAAGFAGSVAIGFEMVSELQRWLGPIPADQGILKSSTTCPARDHFSSFDWITMPRGDTTHT